MTMDVATLGIRVDATQADRASSSLDRLGVSGGRAQASMTSAERAAQTMGVRMSSLNAVVGAFGVTLGLVGLVSLVKDFFGVNRVMQSLRTSLETVTGSANSARNAFVGIQKFAADTPYAVKQVTEAFIKLSNYGLKAGEAQLTSYGNTASAMGKSLNQMIEAVADAASGEFERLKEFGIKSSKHGDQVAFTFHGMTTVVRNSADQIESYLQKIGDTDFAGGMERQSKTVDGAISNLSDSWNNLLDTIMDNGAEQRMARTISGLSDMINAAANVGGTMISVGGDSVRMGDMMESAWLLAKNSAVDAYDSMVSESPRTMSALQTAASFIGDVFANAWRMVKDLAALAVNGVVGLFVGMGSALGVAAAGIVTVFSQSFEKIKAMAGGVGLGIEAALAGDLSFKDFTAAINTKVKTFSDVGTEIGDAFVSGFVSAQNTTGKLGDALDSLGKKVASGAKTLHELDMMVKSNADAADTLRNKNESLATSHDKATKATKAHAAASHKAANAIAAEIAALTDQHNKLSLTERAYQMLRLSALGMTDAVKSSSMAIWDSNKALEAQKTAADFASSTLDALKDKYNQLTLSAREYLKTQLGNQGISGDAQAPILAQFDKNAGVEAQQAALEKTNASMQTYDDLIKQINSSTSDLGATNTAVFDGALGGINTLTGAFTTMTDALAKTTKQQELLNSEYAKEKSKVSSLKLDDRQKYTLMLGKEADYLKANKKLESDKTNESLTGMRQIVGATAQMFDKKSSGAKALHAVEMGIAVAQMAMQGVKMIKNLAETASNIVLGAAKFFGQSAWFGFAGIAAMGAVMAGLGYAMSGGGGGGSSTPPPTSSGSGTVLGDSSTQSESIDKTYNLLQDIHASEYRELRGINAGVAALSSGITNVITRLFQAGGLTNVKAPASTNVGYGMMGNAIQMGAMIGSGGLAKFDPIANKVLGFLFGGKQTSTVTAQGISTGATSISDIMGGGNLSAQQFADIKTTTKGGIFSSDKTSYSRQSAALDSETTKALNGVFKSMGETMIGLSDSLGEGISDRVKNYIIPAFTVDLKGLNGEDAAKKLNGVISAALDKMSTSVFGDIIGQYQQLGEGMLETAVRIVSEVAIVKDALATSGLSLASNAIAISDALVQAAGGLKEFQKQFEIYYDKFYTDSEKQSRLQALLAGQLSDVSIGLADSRDGYRKQLEALDLSTAAGQQQYSMLLKLSEGADEYYKGVEDAQAAAKELASKQRSLDIALMESTGNAAGALAAKRHDEIAAMDESLRATKNAIYAAQDLAAAAASSAQLAKQQRSLDIALMELSGNSIGALVAKRMDEIAAMDESLRSTRHIIYALQDFDSVVKITTKSSAVAMQVLQKAVDTERKAITDKYNAGIKTTQEAIDGLTASTDKLRGLSNALKSFLDNLVVAGQESIRRATAQGQIKAALATVQSGGTIGNPDELIKAVDNLAQPSEQLFGNFVDYQRDFLKTAIDIDSLHKLTDLGLTVDDKQLSALRASLDTDKRWYDAEMKRLDDILSGAQAQLDAVNGVTVAVMTVTDAIANLAASIGAQSAAQTAQRAVQGAAQSQASGGGGPSTLAGINQSYQDILGRDADPAGLTYWASSGLDSSSVALSIATSAEAQVNNLYSSLLGRASDVAGAAYWTAAINSGASLSDITAGITGSQEYKSLNGFAVGINEVPYDMTANIHAGERIFPAADNRELMMRLSEPRQTGQDNRALIAEIRVLREEVRAGQAQIAANTRKTATILRDVTQDGTAITTVAAV